MNSKKKSKRSKLWFGNTKSKRSYIRNFPIYLPTLVILHIHKISRIEKVSRSRAFEQILKSYFIYKSSYDIFKINLETLDRLKYNHKAKLPKLTIDNAFIACLEQERAFLNLRMSSMIELIVKWHKFYFFE